MNNGINKFIESIRKGAPEKVSELAYGTVTSVDPLVITRESGEVLTEAFLFLSKLCKPSSLWEGLKIKETVILLSFNDNQRFFVERI